MARDEDAPAPAAGHNSSPAGFASGELRAFVERIERLEEEKQTIQDDIKDIYAEAKGTGFDVKILRQVVRIRKQDKADRDRTRPTAKSKRRCLICTCPPSE